MGDSSAGENQGVGALVDEWVIRAAQFPGPATLTALRDADPARLTPAQLVDAIACSERLMSHLAGLQTTLMTEFAQPGRSGDITRIVEAFTDFNGPARHTDGTLDTDLLHTLVSDHAHGMAAAEIAAALHISPMTARHRVDKAIDLHDGLPATLRALIEGRIDRGRAAMITEHTAILDDPELRAAVEAKILPLAETRTAGRLRPLVDRAVIIADPGAAERRVKKARRGREVTHQPGKDDMSIIRAALPADGAVTVYTLIDLIAASTKTPGDDRGIGERRADALTDLAQQLLSNGHLDLRGLLHNPDDETAEDDDDWSDGGYHHTDLDSTDPDDDADQEDRNNAWQHIDNWDTGHETADPQATLDDPANNTTPWQEPVCEAAPVGATDQQTGTASARNETKSGQIQEYANTPETSTQNVDRDRAPVGGIPLDPSAHKRSETDDKIEDVEQSPSPVTAMADRCTGAPRGVPASSGTSSSQTDTARASSIASAGPTAGGDSGKLLSRQGRRPHLTLTMSMSTLMALDRLPGHLDGYGAITAELAHAIARAAASLSLVIIDPETGSPLHAGRRYSYRPRQQQRDITTTLFDTCRFPSCRQPSWRCDLDHRQPFDHQHPGNGGQTCDDNLDPYCRRHHLLKHHSDWTPQRQPDGAIGWSSPTRHTYTDQPRELTLPGELLHPEPFPRSTIGLADTEHQHECADPTEPDESSSSTNRVKQAIYKQDQQRARDRLNYLKKVIAMPPRPPRDDPEPSWVNDYYKNRAETLRQEFEAAYPVPTPTAANDHPPF